MPNKAGYYWHNLKMRAAVQAVREPNAARVQALRAVQDNPWFDLFRIGPLCEKCRATDEATMEGNDTETLRRMLDHMNKVGSGDLR